jgi:hypothetical protein
MKNIWIYIAIAILYLVEVSVFSFSSQNFFVSFSPIIFFYFLSFPPLFAANVSLGYALCIDIASAYRVPINVLSVVAAFAIYYFSHKKGVDFKYGKNRFLFCCLFGVIKIIAIYVSGVANISLSRISIIIVVNLICIYASFLVFSFITKRLQV